MESYYSLDIKKAKKKNKTIIILLAFFCALLLSSLFFVSYARPKNQTLVVQKGESLRSLSQKAESLGIVRSDITLYFFMRLFKKELKAGTYVFDGKTNLLNVAKRLDSSDYGSVYVFVTIPEGLHRYQIADLLEKNKHISFDRDLFLEKTELLEGQLFPETYAVLPGIDTEEFISLMHEEFQKNISEIGYDSLSENEKRDKIILASIIEKEARDSLMEKQMVADVLYKRLSESIPLQVDAPFLYERGQGSFDLSRADLKKDSLYNTYTRLGLTPSAIANPGHDSLFAVLYPIENSYYFYLHGHDGNIHYGKNYNEHLKNKRMYLQ